MAASQKNRFIGIGTTLGADALLLKSFSLNDQLGRLFQIDVELLSEKPDIDFDALVGSNATIWLNTPAGSTRFFNGCVSRFVQTGHDGSFATYRATLVPWLWLLTRTADCRIFQKKKAPAIIEEVFKAHGFKDYKLKLSATYREWEYCVQYRETDFNFVSRLMEQEGIYYYFEHADGVHTLFLVDSAAAHEAFPDYATLTYRPRTQAQDENSETVTDWVIEREVQPGLWTLADFNFKTPAAPILVNANINRSHENAGFEIFDYPGEYTNRQEGDAYAKLRIQEVQSQHEILRGQSTVRGLATGYNFTLRRHFRDDQNRAYLATGTSLQASTGAYESGAGSGGDFFACGFTAVPAADPFRSVRSTPKPLIQGAQTAIVVGPKGEEIHTDKDACVKCQFHWDRYGKNDENSSCWIRVSQSNAGKGWGSMITPRIGQEVIVEFLEGDPDRPIITGRVYNAEQKPPYAAGGGVVSGLKSQTHKGGGSNEMSMEDTAGKEKITIHGQFDMNTTVENNQTDVIHNNRETTVDVDDTEKIGSNQKIDVGANQTIAVGANRELSVSGNSKTSITGTEETTIGGKSSLKVGGKRSETIGGAHSINNPKMTITSASSYTVAAGSKLIATSPKVNLLAGSQLLANSSGKMDIKSAAKMTQQSGAAMNVKAGAALKVQSSTAMSMKSGAAFKADASGAMSFKSGGAISHKGSVIKLNSPTKIKGTTLTVD